MKIAKVLFHILNMGDELLNTIQKLKETHDQIELYDLSIDNINVNAYLNLAKDLQAKTQIKININNIFLKLSGRSLSDFRLDLRKNYSPSFTHVSVVKAQTFNEFHSDPYINQCMPYTSKDRQLVLVELKSNLKTFVIPSDIPTTLIFDNSGVLYAQISQSNDQKLDNALMYNFKAEIFMCITQQDQTYVYALHTGNKINLINSPIELLNYV